jgi:hypothetical protein
VVGQPAGKKMPARSIQLTLACVLALAGLKVLLP